MRRLSALFLLLPGLAGAERAAPTSVPVRVDSRTGVYRDDDRTTITTSTVAASAQAGNLTVGGRYLVDVISSASVDVVAAATGRFHENRHEAEVSAVHARGADSLSGAYIYSTENDWTSHNLNLGGSRGFLSQNLTVAAGLGLQRNQVGRTDDPGFSRRLDATAGTLGLTYNLSPTRVGQLTLSGTALRGYQASPYRFVRIGVRGPALPETVPDARLRGSVTLRLMQHVLDDSALHLDARGYTDDWGVRSATGGAEMLFGFGELTAGVRARGYAQSAAAFYRGRYTEPLRYMTFDRELGAFADVFAGGRLIWEHAARRFVSGVRLELKLEGFEFWFFDFPALPRRHGLVAELALGASL